MKVIAVFVVSMAAMICPFHQALSSGTSPGSSVETPVPDIPVTIKNGSEPSGGMTTLRMEELWRAGGEDEEYLFGLICDALADREGNILLLDKQLADVKVFSAEGEYLKTLSRQGSGPGETQRPTVLILPDWGGLGIVQYFPPEIVWLDEKGGAVGSWKPDLSDNAGTGLGFIRTARIRSGRLLATCSIMRRVQGKHHRASTLSRFDFQGAMLTQYYEISRPLAGKPDADCDLKTFRSGGWGVDSRGRVYTVRDCGEYRITVQDSSAAVMLIIEREYQRRRRSPEEIRRIEADYRASGVVSQGKEIQVAEYAPPITSIHIAANDELWVLPDRPATDHPDEVLAQYDVFSPEGRFVRQVRLIGDGDHTSDRWHFASEDRLILVRNYQGSLAGYRGAAGGAAEGEGEASPEEAGEIEILCFALRQES